jgi:hypothetical protein
MVSATRKATRHQEWAETIVATLSPAGRRFVTTQMIVLAFGKTAPSVFLANYADSRRHAMESAAYRAAARAVAEMGF